MPVSKVGIEALSKLIVAVLNIIREVRAVLPKFDLLDIGHVIAIARNAISALGKMKDAAVEIKDLDNSEKAFLSELVKYELEEQGIEVENLGLIVHKLLDIFDAIIELIPLIPRRDTVAAENDSTKANEPRA